MIKSIYIENFLSIRRIELKNVDNLEIMGILGGFEDKEGYSNASGKSALAESILFVLAGIHRYKTDIEAIRIGECKAEVRMTHINKKNKLTIIRTIKKKADDKSTLSNVGITLDGTVVASGTREGQRYINNYFSITPEDFLASYFFRQKEYDLLLKSRSGERIKFLQKFFKSYIFDEAKKSSSKARNQLVIDLTVFEGKLQALLEEKEDMSAESVLKSHINMLKTSVIELKRNEELLSKKIKVIDSKVKKENDKNIEAYANLKKSQMYKEQIQDTKGEIDKIIVKKNIYVREIIALNKKVEEFNKSSLFDAKEWTEKEQDRIDKLKEDVDRKLVDIQVNNSKMELIITALDNLEFNLCTVCGQKISDELRKIQIESKNNEMEKWQKKNAEINISVELMQDKLDIRKNNKKKRERLWREKQKKLSSIQSVSIIVKGKEDMCEAFLDQIEELKEKIISISKSSVNIGNTKADKFILKKLDEEKLKINDKIKMIQISTLEKGNELTKKQTLLERIKKLNEKISEVKKNEKSLRQKISDRYVLEDVFEKCKMEIISTGIEELEEHANNIIREVGAVQKEITFEKVKEGQKGEMIDVLDIYLIDEKGKRMINGLSGGEWDLSAFALRTSLARYKLLRMNSIIDFIVLDEVFGALDPNSRDELVNIINMMKDEFSQVFVITHTDLKDAFEHILEVEMTKEGVTRLKTIK